MQSNVFRARARLLAGAVAVSMIAAAQAAAPPGIHDANLTATARPAPPPAVDGSGTVVLTFEGLADGESVLNFYDGGQGGGGSGPGANYGITFADNALVFIDADAGGTGNFGGEPSPSTVMSFLQGSAATMNVPAGFSTGFSFFYSSPFQTGSVVVYDGLNATGNVLATLNLPLTPNNGAPDPTGVYSPLVPFGVTFTGVAHSVDFGGSANSVGFDNITLGSGTPGGGGGTNRSIPAPTLSTWALAALATLIACVGIGVGVRRRIR